MKDRLGPLIAIRGIKSQDNKDLSPFSATLTSATTANKNSRLNQMRNKLQGQMTLNGEQMTNNNRFQLLKTNSERFKKEYIEAMINSFDTKYCLDMVLGQGMHATVYKCFKLEDTKKETPLAVKVIREDDEEKIIAHRNEFKIMESLDNPHIVKGYELFINVQKKEVHEVMKYIDGKEILDQISEMGAYSEKEAQYIFKQIMVGLEYLHSEGVCHRDIKPSNILVTKDQHVTIADFNVARQKSGEIFKMMTKTGTLAHSAPEIFIQTYYDEKIDIWSAGTVLYTILSGQQPFDNENVSRLISKITLGDYSLKGLAWNKISPAAKDLINKMLTLDPQFRPSASQILKHQWFQMNFNHQNEVELTQVMDDFDKRKSLKTFGKISMSQMINVGSIDEEILKKGLEMSNLKYTKSMGYSRDDKNLYFESDHTSLDKYLTTCPNNDHYDTSSSEDDNLFDSSPLKQPENKGTSFQFGQQNIINLKNPTNQQLIEQQPRKKSAQERFNDLE
eukprot:403355208